MIAELYPTQRCEILAIHGDHFFVIIMFYMGNIRKCKIPNFRKHPACSKKYADFLNFVFYSQQNKWDYISTWNFHIFTLQGCLSNSKWRIFWPKKHYFIIFCYFLLIYERLGNTNKLVICNYKVYIRITLGEQIFIHIEFMKIQNGGIF